MMLCCVVASAQEQEVANKLQLAQQLEEASDWEHAVAVYQELYRAMPNNSVVIDGLQRSYAQTKQYDSAIVVIQRWLVREPNNINAMGNLGGLYYDSGHERQADSVWNAVIVIDPRNINVYRYVASEMMEHRLYDKSIAMYLRGRKASGSETTFTQELGSLYAALQNYSDATREYLRLITESPNQLGLVQALINQMLSQSNALAAIAPVVADAVKNSSENLALHRLYAWLLMEEKNFSGALEQYRTIDQQSSAHGLELFNFAQRLHQEHADAVAAEAYSELIAAFPQQSFFSLAKFGYARAKETLMLNANDTSVAAPLAPQVSAVLSLYEELVAAYPKTDLAAQSLYRMGVIKFQTLFDLDGALTAFKQIRAIPQITNISYDAVLQAGDVQMARNDLAEARKEYQSIILVPAYHDQALFKLAEVDYFEAKFDTALAQLQWFKANLKNDLTNRALQLQYFIQENNSSAPQALAEFAHAALLERQRKYSEALAQFDDIIRCYPQALLIDDALVQKAELQIQLGKPADAVATFHFVADSLPRSILKDRAQFRIAEIFQYVLHNKLAAIDAYEQMLAQFPNSLFVEEARKRIRSLRGN
ncbi:MAG TPA: tetratricopeptide repeat protein [Bacteroidota bacterium]|nr:tetratricopeptide repeat protein [Bacteroidota bacterium]